jgi:hypothetical protein
LTRLAIASILRETSQMSALDVAQRGIELATEELLRRGARVAPLLEGRSRNYLSVSAPGRRSVVYVKTRRVGTWHSDARRGTPRSPETDERRYWLFVDLMADPVEFYVVPEWWMENDIHQKHEAFLAEHGGTRPRSPRSTHHGIVADRLAAWRDRWDLLSLP